MVSEPEQGICRNSVFVKGIVQVKDIVAIPIEIPIYEMNPFFDELYLTAVT